MPAVQVLTAELAQRAGMAVAGSVEQAAMAALAESVYWAESAALAGLVVSVDLVVSADSVESEESVDWAVAREFGQPQLQPRLARWQSIRRSGTFS